MISILALLILFGSGGLALAAVIFGVASKRLWFIPVVGLVVLFMLGASGLMFGILAPVMQRHTAYQMSSSTPFPQQMGMTNQTFEVTPFAMSSSVPVWAMGIKWGAILGAILLVLLVRRLTCSHHPHGFWRAWPIIVLACFVGFMFLTRITVSTSYDASQANAQAARQTADAIAAQQQIVKSQEQLRITQSKLEAAARQQILQQHPNAQVVSQSSTVKAAEPNDIHELMDKFDAPRIAVTDASTPPNAPAAPAAAPVAAAPSAPAPTAAVATSDSKPKPADDSASSSEGKKNWAAKSGAASSDKQKKSKAKPANDTKPSAGAVARSKPPEESAKKDENSKKESKPSGKVEAVAEAKSSASASRPAWVDESPKRTGSTRREVISTEQYETIDECYQAADVYLLLKTYERMQQLAGRTTGDAPLPSIAFQNGAILGDGKVMCYGRGAALWNGPDPRLQSMGEMGITADYLRGEIVAKDPKNNESCEYVETVERTFGPMKKLYLQLEFTPAIERQLMRHWDARLRSERFAIVGSGAGALLSLLGLVFALLKIDTWTKGYYTKRLFIGVPAAIIGGAYLLYFVVVLH